MRRIAIGAALTGGVVIVARALAPKLHARMLAVCKGMFEQMPEDFPPKRIMSGVEEIRANTARTLELLQERAPAAETEPLGEVSSTKVVNHAAGGKGEEYAAFGASIAKRNDLAAAPGR